MKQRFVIPVLTALGFAAGFVARVLTESNRAVVPPPPAALGTEFVRTNMPPSAADSKERKAPTFNEKDRAKLVEDIQKLRPQIDAYRVRMDEIAAEFERDLAAILTPEQREKYAAQQKRFAERRARGEREAAETTVLSDEQIFQLQQRPLWNALWNIAIKGRLDRLNHDLKFDPAQQAKARELLLQRREKFLALVDSTPPPSITLSQLATQAEKLAAPARNP